MITAQRGERLCVGLLVKAKADLNLLDEFGTSALGLAEEEGHSKCKALLEAAGATPTEEAG